MWNRLPVVGDINGSQKSGTSKHMGWLISFVAFIVRVPHIDPLQNDPVRRVRRIMKDLCSKAVCVPRLVNSTLSPVKRTHQTINQTDCFLCLVALFRTKITFYNHPFFTSAPEPSFSATINVRQLDWQRPDEKGSTWPFTPESSKSKQPAFHSKSEQLRLPFCLM